MKNLIDSNHGIYRDLPTMMTGSVPRGLDPRSAARVCGQFIRYKQLCPFLDRRITDDRRRSNRIVSGEAEVAYRTANRRGRIEDDNGLPW